MTSTHHALFQQRIWIVLEVASEKQADTLDLGIWDRSGPARKRDDGDDTAALE